MRVFEAPDASGPAMEVPNPSPASNVPTQAEAEKEQNSAGARWQEPPPDYSLTADADIQWGNGATPAGLKNIGNTCYLNSVLQYFFTIKEIREQVMQAAAVIAQSQQPWDGSELRVGGRKVTPAEIERSRKFVVHLSNLFDNMITSPAAAVEPERELAYLALVSSRTEEAVLNTQEAENRTLPEAIAEVKAEVAEAKAQEAAPGDAMDMDAQAETESSPAKGEKTQAPPISAESITGSPAETVAPPAPEGPETTATAAPNASPQPGLSITDATSKPQVEAQAQESLMQLGAQQDVGECLDNVVFQIEVGLRSAGARPEPLSQAQEQGKRDSPETAASLNSAIERLFVGVSSQRVVAIDPAPDAKPSEPKREIFTLIPIDITHEGCDVYDGLDNFFDDEQVEGSNVRRTVTLQEPPAILQIQAQRVQYDRLQGKAFKALTHLDVGEVISLDRYLELPEGHPNKAVHDARRLETANLRKTEADVAKRKAALFRGKTSMADTLRTLSNILNAYAARPGGSGLNEDDLKAMEGVANQQAGDVTADLERLEKELVTLKSQREGIWKEDTETLYELVAVFMHRGEATHGHYFLNQRRLPDATADGPKWLKYNDEQVADVTVQEVLKDSTGATPYLLIYVRRKPDSAVTIDTVRRSIAGMAPPIPGPTSEPAPAPAPVPATISASTSEPTPAAVEAEGVPPPLPPTSEPTASTPLPADPTVGVAPQTTAPATVPASAPAEIRASIPASGPAPSAMTESDAMAVDQPETEAVSAPKGTSEEEHGKGALPAMASSAPISEPENAGGAHSDAPSMPTTSGPASAMPAPAQGQTGPVPSTATAFGDHGKVSGQPSNAADSSAGAGDAMEME